MSKKNPREFAEVWTHEAAYALIKDTVEYYGARLNVKVHPHKYESTSPNGSVKIEVRKYPSFQTIRYGLPDDRDELKTMAIKALEPPEEWKARRGT